MLSNSPCNQRRCRGHVAGNVFDEQGDSRDKASNGFTSELLRNHREAAITRAVPGLTQSTAGLRARRNNVIEIRPETMGQLRDRYMLPSCGTRGNARLPP